MSPSYLLFVFFVLCSIAAVFGDIYLQHPPGNNNRFQEQGDRQTATRLFNSQNNARGGYCWGATMTYYEGSILAVEWTNQHSCGVDNNRCEVILQYMCGSDAEGDDETMFIRDGNENNQERIPTGTTPGQDDYFNRKNANGELRFGMNEPLSNYQSCIQRQRNKGLWISTETPGDGNGAMATRQNAGGTRYGFECTEERDHYPYWHPSPWKDIVVFTTQKSRCDYYKSESQNVKAKNYCANITDTGNGKTPNNEQDCARNGGQWKSQPSWGIGKPECKQAPHNRDNHLGNGDGVHTNSYNWTLPRAGNEDCIRNGNCTCVLRIRYNITVGEVPFELDWRANGKRSPVKDNQDLPYMGANYTFTINDNQAARTFQDRSYMFRIAPRPSGVPTSATIYNLNVRGKRGNIVQTYPATEYDFVPTFLTVTQGDYIHFQWTGCDNNPANQDGQGRDRTDRSNIVQMKDMSRNFPLNETEMKSHRPLLFKDAALRARMAMIDQQNCLSREDLEKAEAETGLDEEENPQNCFLLNAAGPRFSGAIVKMTDVGFYAYMSTRNNNFSNRSQKGSITVESSWKPWKTAVVVVSGVVAVAVGAAAGTIFYAKRHPLSRVAEVVHKVPGFSKV